VRSDRFRDLVASGTDQPQLGALPILEDRCDAVDGTFHQEEEQAETKERGCTNRRDRRPFGSFGFGQPEGTRPGGGGGEAKLFCAAKKFLCDLAWAVAGNGDDSLVSYWGGLRCRGYFFPLSRSIARSRRRRDCTLTLLLSRSTSPSSLRMALSVAVSSPQ
jgi:hypothetical protein